MEILKTREKKRKGKILIRSHPHAFTSNPLGSVRVVPSGFVTTTFQIPFEWSGIVNHAVIRVELSQRTFLALIRVTIPVLFVSFALISPAWKSEPMIVISTLSPIVEVGLMLVIPCESVGVVVPDGLGDPRIENILAYFTN